MTTLPQRQVLAFRPLLQNETGGRRTDPTQADERHLGNECPDDGVDQAQGNGEDAYEDVSHVVVNQAVTART